MKKLLIALGVVLWLGGSIESSSAITTRPSRVCPSEIEPLTMLMIRDLPGYGNRVITRSRTRYKAISSLDSIIMAGKPEFVPLPLNSGTSSIIPDSQNKSDLRQVFITTLERQNTVGTPIELQQFHWLFLTRTETGWRLALMFTRTGTTEIKQPITPPRESSQGVIGQAVRTWLRDCNAGAVRS